MQSVIKIIIPALIFSTPILAQGQTQKTPSEISREQSQAMVVIESLDDRGSVIGQGSGFIVTSNGAIVSNLHVVKGASMTRIKLPNGDLYKTADVIDTDDNKDIIILKIKGFQLPTVKLGDSDRVEVGESIVAISSPEGLTNTISTGVISGVRRLDTHRVFQITAPISHGSSGGALFDSTGSVIGIITYVFKSGQNINFAVPINYARGMISDQVRTTLARLQPASSQKEDSAPAPGLTEPRRTEEQIDDQITTAAKGRLGRSQQDPMFVQPYEALSFFYRLVDGIGLYTTQEVADLTRTAAVVKSKETDAFEEYTIKYLSFYSGVAMGFGKPDRLLASVELLVNWSVTDLENTFGNKYRKRTVGNLKVLDFGKTQEGKQLVAVMDGNGNVRSVRFTKK
jgi:hypothetical protein